MYLVKSVCMALTTDLAEPCVCKACRQTLQTQGFSRLSICRNCLSFLCFTLTENVMNCLALNPLPFLNAAWRFYVNKSNYE